MQIKSKDSSSYTDAEGFLLDHHAWNKAIAMEIAIKENIHLTEEHWTIISLLREFYELYETSPALRILIKKAQEKMGHEKANSIFLHKLFPGGPIKQASKIAGLPKPLKCI
jgi:tRNA 2-thiouridine synthesizing protein E